MTDEQFLKALHSGAITEFRHRDHLRLAFAIVGHPTATPPLDRVRSVIQSFAAHHGQSAKYHETLTAFWLGAVIHAFESFRPGTFERLLVLAPHLEDKRLPWNHWSDALLMSDLARERWVEPDVAPLPWQGQIGSLPVR